MAVAGEQVYRNTDTDNKRGKVAGIFIGQPQNRGAHAFGFLNQADQLAQGGFLPDLFYPDHQHAGIAGGAGIDVIANSLVHRLGFPRKGSLVDCGSAPDHYPVN
ncbi:MAG: hypothetical protein BWY80_01408 [Firmicutes bacterium ADurb.Bin456]|nr:MAG: hypothetical protein BWY80_01408 [Firmicutes bacterium ADurb.Bin456]